MEKELHVLMGEGMLEYGLATQYDFIPSNIDGLKPTQRKVLYTLWDNHTGHTQKSTLLVGKVMEYMTTGDSGVYESMAHMAQTDRHNYPLVKSQGNFGSIIDTLKPASARYTEAMLSQFASDWYFCEDMKYTHWVRNAIDTADEPLVLPTLMPMGLIFANMGMALGASSATYPLNLHSVAKAYIEFIKAKANKVKMDKKFERKLYKDLVFEFPNKCRVLKFTEDLFETGSGSIQITGDIHVEDGDYGRKKIVITRLPYMVEVPAFIAKFKDMPEEIKSIVAEINDESDASGVRITLTIKKDKNPSIFVDYLTMGGSIFTSGRLVETNRINYKYFSYEHNMVLDYSVIKLFEEHYNYKMNTLTKYFSAVIDETSYRLELLNGLLYIISDKKRLDKFIEIVKASTDDMLIKNLSKAFPNLKDYVLEYVAEQKFRSMTKNCDRIRHQIQELEKKLKEAKDNFSNKEKYLINRITEVLKKY